MGVYLELWHYMFDELLLLLEENRLRVKIGIQIWVVHLVAVLELTERLFVLLSSSLLFTWTASLVRCTMRFDPNVLMYWYEDVRAYPLLYQKNVRRSNIRTNNA